ncbi:Phosphomannomutase, partial [Nowakowskiella sp. JEL0078]
LSERDAYEIFDKENNIRSKFVTTLKETFFDYGLTYSIGGQISFDVFPEGWDKTFCLKHLEGEGFDTIHFFGDKYFKGGNDYEIYNHPATIGHAVESPLDTMRILNELFDLSNVDLELSNGDGLISKVISNMEKLESRLEKIESAISAISKQLARDSAEGGNGAKIEFKITN